MIKTGGDNKDGYKDHTHGTDQPSLFTRGAVKGFEYVGFSFRI